MSDPTHVQLTVQDSQLAAKWTEFLNAYYIEKVNAAALAYPDVRSVEVEFKHVELRDPELADYLLVRPMHALRVGETALFGLDLAADPKPRLRLRVTGLPDSAGIPIRGLRAEHLGRFVKIDAFVHRVAEVRPFLLEGAFECKSCGNIIHLIQDEELVGEPSMCDACEKTGNIWRFRDDMSHWISVQKVELQEPRDKIDDATRQENLVAWLRDDLVHGVVAGDRVHANGILVTANRRQGTQRRTEFAKVLEVNSVEHKQRHFHDVVITDEDRQRLQEFGGQSDVVEQLVASFAPHVYERDELKEAMLLFLMGGVAKHYDDGSRTRGDIHVLIVGDPGMAKSQVLQWASNLAPRSIRTAGKSASAAGLTGTVSKDGFDGDKWTVEAGAMVLADRGIIVVDELDKMGKEDRSAMHPAMEQQEINIAKGGVHARLMSRCGVLGAANPKLGKFDAYQPVAGQINMPPALLSRFDLIFALVDKPQLDVEKRISAGILRTQQMGQRIERARARGEVHEAPEDDKVPMSPDELRKYIAMGKEIVPLLGDDAVVILDEYFVGTRTGAGDIMGVTARLLEALVRLSEASARLHLRDEILAEDAERAVRIVESAMRSLGKDAATGQVDLTAIMTGRPKSQHDRINLVMDVIRRQAKQSPKHWTREEDVLEEAQQLGVDEGEARKVIQTLRRNNSIYQLGGPGTLAPLNP